jgi:hypothetical protein
VTTIRLAYCTTMNALLLYGPFCVCLLISPREA